MLACKKDDEGSGIPTPQYPFINFVDSAGNNLFLTNAIDTSEFRYDYNGSIMSWDDIFEFRTRTLSKDNFTEDVDILLAEKFESNPYIMLENTFGSLDVTRRIIINGKEHYFRFAFSFASYEGNFTQNGEALIYNTETVGSSLNVFVHNIVLNEY